MRRFYCNIAFTVFFIILLAFGINIHFQSQAKDEISDSLSFIVQPNDQSGEMEEIACWKQDDRNYVVFLPSYADLNDVEIHMNSSSSIYIEDIELREGQTCDSFCLDTEYEIRTEKALTRIIKFVQSAGVPSMFISTSHNDLDKINGDKNLKEYINISIHESDGQILYYSNTYDDQIRGHGNSSWEYQKKPYNLYLENAKSLLGMDAADEWVLLANANDETNLRNKMIYDFINKVSGDTKMAPNCEYVELYIDGNYLGLYLLCEKLQNIAAGMYKDCDYTLISQNNTTNKMDFPDAAITFKNKYNFEIVSADDYSVESNEDFLNYLNLLDQKLSGDEWSDYIDVHSFALKYLIEEIFSNKDGNSHSQYFYWDQVNNRLYIGPCWDYDLTMGDTTFVRWMSPNNLYVRDGLWFKQLFEQEEFCDYYKQLYQEQFLPLINDYLDNKIIETYATIEKSSLNNYVRWSDMYDESDSSPNDIIAFLSEHVKFLNSLWIDNVEYNKIAFKSNGERPAVSLYLPHGSSCELIPTPKEMGFGDTDGWHYSDSGLSLDNNKIITDNLTLYVDNKEPDDSSIKKLPSPKIVVPILICVMALMFGVILLFDHRYNVQKGKPINE